MLVGEPGIGKTRTAQELETYARMRGAQVFWGRAHESSGAPAYWPWVQVGTAWGANDLAALAEVLRARVTNPELAAALPRSSGSCSPASPSSHARRARRVRPVPALFDAYAQFMRARLKPSSRWLVVLDDLHWADKPTLLLLQHLARELANMRVLVVGTYRDTDLARTHPLVRGARGAQPRA